MRRLVVIACALVLLAPACVPTDLTSPKDNGMSVTGWKNPSANGQINAEWTNAGNCYTSNNVRATVTDTQRHDFYGFGFTSSDIPDGSIIDWLEVSVEGRCSATDNEFLLQCDWVRAGVIREEIESATLDWTETTDTIKASLDNGWGLGPPLVTDIVGVTTFGLHFTCTDVASGGGTLQIDHVKLRVYYHAGPSTTGRITAIQGDLTYSPMTGRVTAGQADLTYSEKTARITAAQSDLIYGLKTGRITAAQAGLTYDPKTGRVTAIQGDVVYDRMGGRVTAMQGDLVYDPIGAKITAMQAELNNSQAWYMMGQVYCTLFGQYKNEWTDAGFARVDGENYATSLGLDPTKDEQDYYSFSLPLGLPTSAILRGVTVCVVGSCTNTSSVMDLDARLLQYIGNTPTPVGNTKTARWSDPADQGRFFGDEFDLWGSSLTWADVTNLRFGVYLKTKYVSGTDGFRVDYLTLNLSYITDAILDPANVVKVEVSPDAIQSMVIPRTLRTRH